MIIKVLFDGKSGSEASMIWIIGEYGERIEDATA